jgi:hypothetical protein
MTTIKLDDLRRQVDGAGDNRRIRAVGTLFARFALGIGNLCGRPTGWVCEANPEAAGLRRAS